MNIQNLIPRTSQNVEVRYIPEEEWYRLTDERNEDGYGVFRDGVLIYSNHDPIEASYEFDEVTHEHSIQHRQGTDRQVLPKAVLCRAR